MTPTEAKQAHDEIWAVRKKIKGFKSIAINSRPPCIVTFLDINGYKSLRTKTQVRRFLDGLE